MDQIPPGLDLCMFPAGLAPNGTSSNLQNPKTLVPVLIPICIIMSVGAILFTALRLCANWRKMWWSDYFAIIALTLSLANTGLMLAQTKFARHQWDIRACWYDGNYTKILFSQQIILTFVLFFSKCSVFLLYQQIFDVQRPMRIAIRVGIVFTGLLYFTNIPLSAILSAPHIGETWGSVLLSGRPQKELIWGVVQSTLGILLDLYIFILPIPVILKLHLSTKKKIQLLVVFTTALVGVVASVLSLVFRVEAIGTNDGTWKYTSLLICSVVEIDVAIIVSCTPGFVNFTRVYISDLPIVKSLRSTLGGSSNSGSGFTIKPSKSDKEDPNRPRTRNGPEWKENHEFDELGSNFFKSASSTERGEGEESISLPPTAASPGIIRAIEVSQEMGGPYNIPEYGPITHVSSNLHFQNSREGLVPQRP
ncbi:hypothetical protein LSUE1_G004336 [Lachnellula suecica]|uniref:Rhodopsin domain-containing protein n=1 Tax=Lachnellula suecica TaxID=602035 RepID=A0A8T9C5G1_9HELO|nr:hypothetical protein LSUE1_G004336 [Lachnellula suecica]